MGTYYGYLCRQGEESSTLYMRCLSTPEPVPYLFQWSDQYAVEEQSSQLQAFLWGLACIHTPKLLIRTFHYKLALTFHIPFDISYCEAHNSSLVLPSILMIAIRRQNILGWDISTDVVVWPEVAYLMVVGLFPTQWTGLSIELVCVGSRLHKPAVCTRSGGHHGRWKHGLA